MYPRELEEFFFTHPAVADVQIIGIPDERYGEEIVAWIKFHPGQVANALELQTWCKDRIAYFKTPRHFKFVDEFPMTVTERSRSFGCVRSVSRSWRLLATEGGWNRSVGYVDTTV